MRWFAVILALLGVANPWCGCGETAAIESHVISPTHLCEKAGHDHLPGEVPNDGHDHDPGMPHTAPRVLASTDGFVPLVSVSDGFGFAALETSLLTKWLKLDQPELIPLILKNRPPAGYPPQAYCVLLI